MKKLVSLLLSFVFCFGLLFSACSDATSNPDKDITGITFESQTFVYDGTEKTITISGKLPDGVTVAYENNKATEVGVKTAKATLSGKGYKTLVLTATLNITSSSSPSNPGGSTTPGGGNDNPGGSTTPGSGNEGGNNINALEIASAVCSAFGNTPDPWNFLPSSFSAQNRALSSAPTYTSFTNVSSLPKNGIGKQLSVAYDLLNKTEKALSYVTPVFSAMNVIKTAYTEFIDKNPEDYKSFSSTVAGITFSLSLDQNSYTLSATVSSVAVKLYSNTQTKSFGARVQLNNSTALKYEVNEDNLKIAMDVLDTIAVQIEFVKNDDKVLGYVYEYVTAGDKTLVATSCLIEVGETYTTLIGTKGDFIPTAISRNCEVYLNSTGQLVGTEVREELTISSLTATYNTLWYPLYNVSGVTNIKKVDEMNGTNADTIYINNSSETIHTKLVGLSDLKKSPSRKFDIEFKTQYYYKYNPSTEEYEKISCEVPMIFIQEEQIDSFEKDFNDANEKSLSSTVTLNVSTSVKNAVKYGYYTLLQAYDVIKDNVTFASITNYCKTA